jgi:hypothetical protein
MRCSCCPAIHCTTTIDGHQDCAAAVAVPHCDTCRHPLPPLLPITTTIAHRDRAAIPLSIAHLPPSPIAIVLLLRPPPLNMLAGCHVGLVVLASPPCRWGRGVPPLPGRGYWRYSLVCHRGCLPWCHRPVKGDKDSTNNDDRGKDK